MAGWLACDMSKPDPPNRFSGFDTFAAKVKESRQKGESIEADDNLRAIHKEMEAWTSIRDVRLACFRGAVQMANNCLEEMAKTPSITTSSTQADVMWATYKDVWAHVLEPEFVRLRAAMHDVDGAYVKYRKTLEDLSK